MYEYHFIETSNLVDKREICAEPIVRAKNSFTDNAPYIAARSEPAPHSRLQHEDYRAVVAGLQHQRTVCYVGLTAGAGVHGG